MAVRGAIAKEKVVEKLAEAFGDNWIGEVDKKYYVWANDGGADKVQIAIALTCPKTFVEAGIVNTSSSGSGDFDFSDETPKAQAEISDTEKENIARLMKELGL